MPKRKTTIWIIVGAAVLIGIIYFAFLRKPKVQYETFEAKKGELAQTVSVTGTLKANDTLTLNFEPTGRINEVDVKVGQEVAKGEVLAVLDIENLQLKADQAKADLDKARAEAGENNDFIHSAEVRVKNAEEALKDTKNLNDANIDAADQTTEDAKNKLDDAQKYYNQVKADDGESSAEAKLAKLTLDSAEASYNDAQKSEDVAEQTAELAETKAENDLNAAEAELAEDKSKYLAAANDAKVAGFEAAYETALNNLDKATLRAPAAGIIKEINFKVGEVYGGVLSNSKNTTDFGKMISYDYILEAKVPESDIAKIKDGQKASVVFDAFSADEKFDATVVSIEPSATVVEDVVDYIVKLTMDSSDQRFKDGMSADVDIAIQKKEGVISIPQRAVQDSGDKRTVQILESGKSVEREVKLGLEGDGGMVEVTSGLSEGDLVITSSK